MCFKLNLGMFEMLGNMMGNMCGKARKLETSDGLSMYISPSKCIAPTMGIWPEAPSHASPWVPKSAAPVLRGSPRFFPGGHLVKKILDQNFIGSEFEYSGELLDQNLRTLDQNIMNRILESKTIYVNNRRLEPNQQNMGVLAQKIGSHHKQWW